MIMTIIQKISGLLWGMPLIVLILAAGLIFTLGSRFFQVTHFGHIMKNTIGTLLGKRDSGKGSGMMRPLEVISIAVATSAAWPPPSPPAGPARCFGSGWPPSWA